MRISILTPMVLFVLLAGLFTSCEDIENPVNTNPKITFGGTAGADATVKACEELTLPITASQGASPLKAIEISEDGTKIDISRIKMNGKDVSGNPILLTGTDKTSLDAILIIKASCSAGDKTISIKIIDDANKSTILTKKVKTESIPPTSKYNGPASIETGANTTNIFNFDVTKGSGKIVTVEVQENDLKITGLNRLTLNDAKFTANPEALPAMLQDGFTAGKIGVKTSANPGTYKYTFIFTDEAGNKTKQDVTVKVGTPLTLTPKFAVFWNQSGPNGGGLDLDEGVNTGYTSALAEMVDNGIDSTQTDKAKNWKQTIRGVNGTELRLLKKAVDVEASFTINQIQYADQIALLFDKGKTVVGQKIVKDDIIVAKKGSKYYLVEIANVIVTLADNEDKYEVNIIH